MKRFIVLASVVPGAAVAHGGHAPLPDSLHGLSHGGLLAGAAVVLLAVGVVCYQRWKL